MVLIVIWWNRSWTLMGNFAGCTVILNYVCTTLDCTGGLTESLNVHVSLEAARPPVVKLTGLSLADQATSPQPVDWQRRLCILDDSRDYSTRLVESDNRRYEMIFPHPGRSRYSFSFTSRKLTTDPTASPHYQQRPSKMGHVSIVVIPCVNP